MARNAAENNSPLYSVPTTMDKGTDLKNNQAYARGATAVITDLTNSGQMGYVTNDKYWHGAADYVKQNVIAFLMEYPMGFHDLEDTEKWISCLKALIELHPRSISGLDQTLNVDYTESPYGGAGEMMETPAKVKRERSNVSIDWIEKVGMPIKWFWTGYILNLIGNPDTNVPEVVSRGKVTPYGYFPDYYTFSVLFIEPDKTQRRVNEAWLIVNMAPKNGVKNEGSRDITETPSNVTHSIPFTGIQQVGVGVLRLAQKVLDRANQQGISPTLRKASLDDVHPTIQKMADVGYIPGMRDLGLRRVDIGEPQLPDVLIPGGDVNNTGNVQPDVV